MMPQKFLINQPDRDLDISTAIINHGSGGNSLKFSFGRVGGNDTYRVLEIPKKNQ